MRVDRELMREDDVAVNWREFYAGASEVLVKSIDSVALVDQGLFVSGKAPS
jgi:phosphoribosyl-dephospho-CoA transferase